MEYFAEAYLGPQLNSKGTRTPITTILDSAAKIAYKKKKLPEDIQLMKQAYESCVADKSKHTASEFQAFYKGLYGTLSKAIHGAPWSGPGVKNTFQNLPQEEKYECVVAYICKHKLNLELED